MGPLELSLHWALAIAHGGLTNFFKRDIMRQWYGAATAAHALTAINRPVRLVASATQRSAVHYRKPRKCTYFLNYLKHVKILDVFSIR